MTNNPKLSLKDPKKLRSPPPSFQCSETIEEGEVGSVSFTCTLPFTSTPLIFSCRGRSVGVLIEDEAVVKDDELEQVNGDAVDPNFFDTGYTLAGRTGFQVWAGSRLCLETLTFPQEISDSPRLQELQRLVRHGGKVLELGSGVGVVGTALAAVGAQVLLTDLPTLVEHATHINLQLNRNEESEKEEIAPPTWLSENALGIQSGWANTASLDWTKPLHAQLSSSQCTELDMIVACDCVWLSSMLQSLLNTVASLFEASPGAIFLLSFQRRDDGSLKSQEEGSCGSMFTTVDGVVEAVLERGWYMECLSWRPVLLDGVLTDKEVFVFEIRPSNK
mmetsp:Transcript_24424/g.36420  ORF Transcript_24424/g.36420 Transcript_24424/m.36420 type:complete len:333 (+) Transcript_24424:260-1258(+)